MKRGAPSFAVRPAIVLAPSVALRGVLAACMTTRTARSDRCVPQRVRSTCAHVANPASAGRDSIELRESEAANS